MLFFYIRYFINNWSKAKNIELRTTFQERYPFTRREIDIIKHVIKGYSNNDIADDLEISLNTVKVHLQNIFQKTGVRSKTELLSIIIHEV